MTYMELLPQLTVNHHIMFVVLKPLKPPYPKWYDPNAHYEYYNGILSYSTEGYTPFKYKMQRLVKSSALNFEEHGIVGVSLPDHMENQRSIEPLCVFEKTF